jgi:hypothetical protein
MEEHGNATNKTLALSFLRERLLSVNNLNRFILN